MSHNYMCAHEIVVVFRHSKNLVFFFHSTTVGRVMAGDAMQCDDDEKRWQQAEDERQVDEMTITR